MLYGPYHSGSGRKLMVDNDWARCLLSMPLTSPLVITDRDIVCRVVARGMNPAAHTVEQYMSRPVVTVRADTPIDEIVSTMEAHLIRRVPVVDDRGCVPASSLKPISHRTAPEHEVAELVREARETRQRSRR